MQVYRHMDIGSAKITPDEMDGIPHHLIDVLDPWEEFHVCGSRRWQRPPRKRFAPETIFHRCGRNRIYIQALLYDIDFTEETDEAYRGQLRSWRREGQRVSARPTRPADPESAGMIHENNRKRVIARWISPHHRTAAVGTQRAAEAAHIPLSFRIFCPDG